MKPFANGPQFYAAIQADALVGDAMLARWKRRRLAIGLMVGIIGLHSAAALHNVRHQAALERTPSVPVSSR